MMILTCPNCATRFFVERESVGPAGRRVKCSACATEWVAYRADDGEGEPAHAAAPESASSPEPSAHSEPEDIQPATSDTPEAQEAWETPVVPPEDEPRSEPATLPLLKERVQDDSAPEDQHETSWADAPAPEEVDTLETVAVETAEPAATAPDETPLFTDRAATAQALAKRKRGSTGLLLLIALVVVLAAFAGLIYYRAHHNPAPPPSISGTKGPGAVRG